MSATNYEMSKTYQYRKVVKPLLERKRRARINKCLDDLKDLIGEFIQQENAMNSDDGQVKLEKADILEVTVNHLRKLKVQRQRQWHGERQGTTNGGEQCKKESFRSGYIQAANDVSRCLASLPKVDVAFGTKLMTHLGLRLNQLEEFHRQQHLQLHQQSRQHSNFGMNSIALPAQKPLQVNCIAPQYSSSSSSYQAAQLHSPVSSGYASDSDSSRSSPTLYSYQNIDPVQQTGNIWRPW